MILAGRKMKFASRKRLNQQTKAEKQFSPAMPIHLSKKQMVGRKSFLTQIIEMKRNGAPGETRTHDSLLRRQTLYPTELRAHRAVILILKHFLIPQLPVSSSLGRME
jgi:hypothetical protein